MASGEPPPLARWPEGVAGTQLLSVRVEKPVDELFLLLYGSITEFTTKFNAAVGNRDMTATDWCTSTNQFGTGGNGGQAPTLANLRAGMVRQVRFSGTSMGSVFTTEELQQMEEAKPAATYRLEVCVSTTATYGDRFRPVLRHTLRAAGPGAAHLLVEATVVFVGKVNGIIKGLIERGKQRGARDGMAKNYVAYRKVLQDSAAVVDEAPGAALAGPGAPPGAPPAAAEAPGFLASLVGSELAAATWPWAEAAQSLPVLGMVGSPALQAALCALAALAVLQLVMQVLAFLDHASREPHDMFATAANLMFKVVDVPDNSREVLVAAGILMVVRMLTTAVAGFIPAPPPPSPPVVRVVTPQPAPALEPAPSPTVEPEAQTEGVKYEGYAEAIASAQGQASSASPGRGTASPGRGTPLAVVSPRSPVVSPAKSSASGGTVSAPGTPATAALGGALEVVTRGESETDLEAEKLMSPKGRARELSGPTTRLAGGLAVMEEVFENERLQASVEGSGPFRGWGYSWPGHFLPTDRVAHWSLREVPGKPVVASQEFKRVVPRVQQGWRWVESTWHLDLSGQLVDAVDVDGWAYGLDFGWLVFPFPEGGGHKKYSDFVRRRRWIRTRVPLADGAKAPTSGAAEPEEAVAAAEPRPVETTKPSLHAETVAELQAMSKSMAAKAVASALLAMPTDSEGEEDGGGAQPPGRGPAEDEEAESDTGHLRVNPGTAAEGSTSAATSQESEEAAPPPSGAQTPVVADGEGQTTTEGSLEEEEQHEEHEEQGDGAEAEQGDDKAGPDSGHLML